MKLDIEELKKLALKAAEGAEYDAGMGGAMHDGGATVMRMQVKFYEMGQRGEIPAEWAEYAKKLDPEWPEYVRLAEKFGGLK